MCHHCNMNVTNNDNIIEAPETRGEFKEYLQKNKSKQIIVYATATWCKPCRTSKPTILKLFNDLAIQNKILMVLDIDKCRDVSSFLKIRGVPLMMLYSNGEPTYSVRGGGIGDIEKFFKKIT